MNGIVRTIVLSGNDSINFANSIFRPTHEEIIAVKEKMDFLDESIELIDNENGFIANIPTLDLSFLDESTDESRRISIDITVNVKTDLEMFFNTNDNSNGNRTVKIQISKDYCDSTDNDLIMIAA